MAITRYLQVTVALAETIRVLHEVPNGQLYVVAMQHGLTFGAYSEMIASLKRAKLITESANVLRWVGPELKATNMRTRYRLYREEGFGIIAAFCYATRIWR